MGVSAGETVQIDLTIGRHVLIKGVLEEQVEAIVFGRPVREPDDGFGEIAVEERSRPVVGAGEVEFPEQTPVRVDLHFDIVAEQEADPIVVGPGVFTPLQRQARLQLLGRVLDGRTDRRAIKFAGQIVLDCAKLALETKGPTLEWGEV